MKNSSQGDISIYIVIVVGMMILGSAVLLGLILARQISLTEDLVASERAFYAASAGNEEGFYRLALAIKAQGGSSAPSEIIEDNLEDMAPPHHWVVYTINGSDQRAEYTGNISRRGGVVCGSTTGTFAGERRRIQIGPSAC